MLDPSTLYSRQLLLVTGKGGIGKSLVAAGLAQLAAERGVRTLLVESAARAQLAPLFGARFPTGEEHERLALSPTLSTVNLDPPDNFREYVVKYLGQRVLYETVFNHKVVKSFINTVPGLAELMLLGRLFYHCELAPPPRPELVIFDGFASGHFLSLMTTPDAVLQSNLGGPLARETERVRGFLADRARVGVLYVAVPEELVVSEALDFLPQLAARSPARVLGIAVNRVPEAVSPEAAATSAGAYLERRARAAVRALALLRAGVAASGDAVPLWTLPERGFIDEPLPPGFGAGFVAGAGGG